MKRIVLGLFTCVAVVIASGCGSSSTTAPANTLGTSVVGIWEANQEIPELKAQFKIVFELTADGKIKVTFGDMPAQAPAPPMEGTYKQEGNKLWLTIKKGDKDDTESMTIKELTDTTMVLANDKKKEDLKFTRKK